MAFLDTLVVEPLPPAFDAGGFDCGERDLTDYLCDGSAARDQAANVSRTYLVKSEGQLVGYFSILADALTLAVKERPPDCSYSSAPALKLGRMAVAKEFRRRDVGPWILKAVVGIARQMARTVGLRYVTLDALPADSLVGWYERYGFVRNEGQERRQRILRKEFGSVALAEPLPTVSMRLDILTQARETDARALLDGA